MPTLIKTVCECAFRRHFSEKKMAVCVATAYRSYATHFTCTPKPKHYGRKALIPAGNFFFLF